MVAGSGHNLPAITGKAKAPNSEAVSTHIAIVLRAHGRTRSKIGKVEDCVVIVIVGIGRREADGVTNRRICEEPVVGGEGSVGNGPLTKRIIHRLVVLPFVRVAGVVHSHFEVLSTAKEEIPIVRVLAAVGTGVVMDDLIRSCIVGNHFLGNQVVLPTETGAGVYPESAPHEPFAYILSSLAVDVDMMVLGAVDTCLHQVLTMFIRDFGPTVGARVGPATAGVAAGVAEPLVRVVITSIAGRRAGNGTVALEELSEGIVGAKERLQVGICHWKVKESVGDAEMLIAAKYQDDRHTCSLFGFGSTAVLFIWVRVSIGGILKDNLDATQISGRI